MLDNPVLKPKITLALALMLLSSWQPLAAMPAPPDSPTPQELRGSAQLPQHIDDGDHDHVRMRIDALAADALSHIIDFERSYLRYQIVASKEPRWRHLRYFLMQDGAAALFLASSAAGTAQSGMGIRNPNSVSSGAEQGTDVAGLVGSALEGASSGLELSSNALLAMKNKRLHRDPKSQLREAIERIKHIDSLLHLREQLVAQTAGTNSFSLYDEETRILRHFRNRSVFEFSTIYADVKSAQSSSNIYYSLDILGCAGYVASYILGIKGINQPGDNPPSYIVGIAADVIFIPAAPLYSYANAKLNQHWQKQFSQQLNEKLIDPASALKEDLSQLKALANSIAAANDADRATLGMLSRVTAYELWADQIEAYTQKRQIDVRRSERVARQANYSGPPIGASFLAADIIGLNASYRVRRDNAKALFANSLGGFIPTTAASAGNFGLTTYWYADDLRHHRNLKKQKALPEQLMAERLRTLDELDKIVGNAKSD
jgi:hypothetical protein